MMWRVAWTGSPDSAETSFRELDDAFLQTQTRIWLGEVLHVRFDEDVGIADLLADGELLFQVSKEVWKMLLRKHGEPKHSKVHIYERTSSGKSDGRYMPYPKVDSFLKICQILGLTGIDLFSPSDVVEKRDIRKVCMCVRSLSKKARSKKLNVPDFDIVTYTISMPTCLVGGIRKNLELSWGSRSSFSTNSPLNDAREFCELHSQHPETRSDESESYFGDLEFKSPFFSASYDFTNNKYLVGETSPELSPMADDFVDETSFNNRIKNSNHYEILHEHQEEMFAEAACSCHLSTTETYPLRNMSSSSYSEHPTDEDSSSYFSDFDKRSTDSIPKVVKNMPEVENLASTLYVEDSHQSLMNASSLNAAPSKDNQHSHPEVHNNVEVEPYNTRQESSFFENAIISNNKSMKNGLSYLETSNHSNLVTPKSYSLDTEADGNDGNSSNEIKSSSVLDLNSLDNFSCDSKLEGSDSNLESTNAYSFLSSFVGKQNDFSGRLVGFSSERKQIELAYTSLSSVEHNCAPLSSPEKEYSVEHTGGLFYDGTTSVDDSDCSDKLKMHQCLHDASEIAFLLSLYESNISPSKKGRAMNVADWESSVNPENCQYDDGKMRDFGDQMTKKLNSFYSKNLDVLDVMESSDFASSGYASKMIPSIDFCHSDLSQNHRNILETETVQIVDVFLSSTTACRERNEVTSGEIIEVDKHIVSYIHDDYAEPNNVPLAILDNTIFQKDTIMVDECGKSKSKDSEGRIVEKTVNQVLKSVAGVMTMVGAFVLFLQARQKKNKEKTNEMWLPFQIQKPNQEFFTKRKIKIGKSDSLYPGEKLKF